MFCDLISLKLNNVSDLIGAKTTKGKECCFIVSSRLWGGAHNSEMRALSLQLQCKCQCWNQIKLLLIQLQIKYSI